VHRTLIAQRFRSGSPVFTSPTRTREFLKLKLGVREHDMFCMLALDNRHRLIEFVELITYDAATRLPDQPTTQLSATIATFCVSPRIVNPEPGGNTPLTWPVVGT